MDCCEKQKYWQNESNKQKEERERERASRHSSNKFQMHTCRSTRRFTQIRYIPRDSTLVIDLEVYILIFALHVDLDLVQMEPQICSLRMF